jgi:hypothetical protein
MDNMHRGDLFYVIAGLLVFLFTWPSADDAKSLQPGWTLRILARNLILEISIYEFWHQVQYGALANDTVKAYKYNPKGPYG